MAWALSSFCIALSAVLTTTSLPRGWSNRLLLLLSVAMGMALQVVLRPACIDGQGKFGQALRDVGWSWTELSNRPAVRASRERLLHGLCRVAAQVWALAVVCGIAGLVLIKSAWAVCASSLSWCLRTVEWHAPAMALWTRCLVFWRRIGVPSMITRWRDCVRWNWQVFLAERESKQTQDWMAAQLTVMVEERKRREGECR